MRLRNRRRSDAAREAVLRSRVAHNALEMHLGGGTEQLTAGNVTDATSRNHSLTRVPLRWSLLRLAIVIVPLALVEGVAYPLILHDSPTWWLAYTAYLALGVILPGTLVAQALVRWRADWLTWIGIGWVLGHVFEVLAIQLCKAVGAPRLFLLWIPIAYLIVWRKRRWQGTITSVDHPLRCAVVLILVLAFASTTFASLNLIELSPQPPYQSDVWFHIGEASEFRDHLDTGDPRLAGEPYAYHTLEYGPAVGANLAVQVPLANLITRYSGMSLVWLLVLLLFNAGRQLRGPFAGFLAAALIVAPLDVFSLISSKLSFGSSIMYSGLDASTSTLVGFVALAGLFLPLRWFLLGGRFRDLWVVALLAYMAAGSKSVPGPLLVVAAAAIIGGSVLQRRMPSRRSVLLMAVFAVTFCATALPILLRPTVAASVTLTFGATAQLNPYIDQLTRIPEWFRLAIYPIGLSLLLWTGFAFGLYRLAKLGEAELCWFLTGALLFGAAVVDATTIPGHSELFFLYMGMVLVAPVAGMGLTWLGTLLVQERKRLTPIAAVIVLGAGLAVHLSVGGVPSPPFYDGSRWAAGLYNNRIAVGVADYQHPGPASSPTPITYAATTRVLRVTPGIMAGLAWLRSVAVSSTVIATNVPGAAYYAALCECREYFQVEEYAEGVSGASISKADQILFADRSRLLEAWVNGQGGSVDMLRKVGITYLVVDHINGLPVVTVDMPRPAFSNSDIAIYRL